MAETTSYQKTYTDQERDECVAWFEQHKESLPKEFVLDASLRTNDLPQTVERMLRVIRQRSITPDSTYSGFMFVLIRIRQKLEEG